MKTMSPGRLPGTAARPEDLIKEARRRQHRRWLTAGAVVAAVLAGAAGVAADLGGHPAGHAGSRGRPRSPAVARQAAAAPIPRSIGTTLLMWPPGYPAFGQTTPGCSTSPRRAPVGLSGDPRRNACIRHAVLPVHGDGRRAESRQFTDLVPGPARLVCVHAAATMHTTFLRDAEPAAMAALNPAGAVRQHRALLH